MLDAKGLADKAEKLSSANKLVSLRSAVDIAVDETLKYYFCQGNAYLRKNLTKRVHRVLKRRDREAVLPVKKSRSWRLKSA